MAGTGVEDLYPSRFNPVFIVLSLLISIVGSWTTFELLQRRTANHGMHNWFLLIAAAFSTGTVAIWSMLHVGDLGVILNGGDESVQLQYSLLFAICSLVLPAFCSSASFYIVTTPKPTRWRYLLSSVLIAAAALGSRLIAYAGINNLVFFFEIGHVIGAATVATIGSTIALGSASHMTTHWHSGWHKRLSCAVMLAASLSGVHWIIVVGTSYRYKTASTAIGISRSPVMVVVLCLCIGCSLVLILLGYLALHSLRWSALATKGVILGIAVIDEEGKIMISPYGSLPFRAMVNSHDESGPLIEMIDRNLKLFSWMHRLTHCWSSLPGQLSPVLSSLWRDNLVGNPTYAPTSEPMVKAKLLFCSAAYELAAVLKVKVEDLGTLYTEAIKIGTVRSGMRWGINNKRDDSPPDPFSLVDATESGLAQSAHICGRMLLLMRQVTKEQANRLCGNGYRFAEVSQIIQRSSRELSMKSGDLAHTLKQIKSILGQQITYQAGIHVVCFAVRPVWRKGFDVLVQKGIPNLLPAVQLNWERLNHHQLEFLYELDGKTVGYLLSNLPDRILLATTEQTGFAAEFLAGIHHLAANIGKRWFLHAKLCAASFSKTSSETTGTLGGVTLIAFRVMADIHDSTEFNPLYQYVPYRHFMAYRHPRHEQNNDYPMPETFSESLMAATVMERRQIDVDDFQPWP